MRLLAFGASGLIQGMIYALVALGIVLVYKGTRVINFAQPFMALFTAFLAHWLTVNAPFMPGSPGSVPRFALAALISLAVIAAISWSIERDLMRRIERAPRLVSLVATIALAQGFVGLTILFFTRTTDQATEFRTLPSLLPTSWSFTSGPVAITSADLLVLLVVPLLAVAGTIFFKRTSFGVAIRASAENRDSAELLGIPTRKVTSFVWVVSGLLAGLASLLIVPVRGSLDVQSVSIEILLRGFAAALVGGLTSISGAFIGGLVVGLSEYVVRFFTSEPGASEVWLFILTFLAVILRPILFKDKEEQPDNVAFIPALPNLPRRLALNPVSAATRRTFIVAGVMLAAAASLATGPSVNQILSRVWIIAIVGISLTVLIGYAGQMSLGHYALVGIGAFATSILYEGSGPIPFLLVLPLVFAIGMVVSLAIGLPALRVRGPYLAILTIAFNIACQTWLFKQPFFGGGTAGRRLTLPSMFALDSQTGRPFYLLCFAMFILMALVASNLKRSRTGRGFFALRENEKTAQTLGVDLRKYRLGAFAVSGGMAALAGALLGFNAGTVTADVFRTEFSLVFVAMVIIGGLGSIVGAAMGSFLVFGLPFLLNFIDDWFVLIGTGFLLITVITRLRSGLAGLIVRTRDPFIEGLILENEARDVASADRAADRVAASAT